MECRSCYEVYDEKERIPRNLPCGHTYCQFCLNQILLMQKRLECPECRIKLDPAVKPTHLSKNFVALEVSSKHREIQKKLQFCNSHKEPLRFFCETCQTNLCASCIIDHSGHKFVKQDHSVALLKERAKDLKTKVDKKIDDLKSASQECRESIQEMQNIQLKYIDEEFDRIISKILAKKEALKARYQDCCEEEIKILEKEIEKANGSTENLTKNMSEVNKYIDKLEKTKLIQGDDLHRELNDIEDSVSKDLSMNPKVISNATSFLPKVIFDPLLYKEIKHIGVTSKDLKNARICFFGEKNKVLVYHIDRDEWALTYLSFGEINEFNYYSSAVTLPDGTILITGGGISNSVYQIQFAPTYPGRMNQHQQVKIIPKAAMHQSRKEHASVFLQGAVYVLGGYDGMMNIFLNSCERYDLETNEWTAMSSMLIPKCAFGATTLSNRYIFTLGGYDGSDRLSSVERYDTQIDKWTLLDVKLKQPLSNSACFPYSHNSIVILGGGYNAGFCLEVNQLDINTNSWKHLAPMGDGRDLRNKLVMLNGNVYAIGGNNCVAERYALKKGEWQLISSYKEFIEDNLDSWSCALYYEIPRKSDEEKHLAMLNTGIKYPIYQTDEHLYNSDGIFGDEDLGDDDSPEDII